MHLLNPSNPLLVPFQLPPGLLHLASVHLQPVVELLEAPFQLFNARAESFKLPLTNLLEGALPLHLWPSGELLPPDLLRGRQSQQT